MNTNICHANITAKNFQNTNYDNTKALCFKLALVYHSLQDSVAEQIKHEAGNKLIYCFSQKEFLFNKKLHRCVNKDKALVLSIILESLAGCIMELCASDFYLSLFSFQLSLIF